MTPLSRRAGQRDEPEYTWWVCSACELRFLAIRPRCPNEETLAFIDHPVTRDKNQS